jgi:ureidoglycolate dehydrogenase (NAD+)
VRGVVDSTTTTRVAADRLAEVMRAALAARGLTDEHAAFVIAGLLGASLRGIDTHGVRLFPVYAAELDGGRAQAQPQLSWTEAGAGGRKLDAGAALGLVAGMVACREAARLARYQGIAAVSVINSNHFGAASTFTIEMARAGTIGICCSNADALTAPFEGTRPLFGTNPLSMAALGDDDELFCLDMATSQISYSQVKARLARGEPLPPHWAVRGNGSDAAGARAASEVAALQPLGGYKGHGLAMTLAILCGLLGDMPLDHELSHFYTEPFDAGRQVSHLFLAIDVASFVDPDVFRKRLTAYLRYTRAQPAAQDGRVRAPGDLEALAQADRRAHGVPLTADDLARFRALGLDAP